MIEIQLTQGKVALIDDSDYEVISQYNWHAWRNKNRYYAIANTPTINGKRKAIKMHRLILGVTDASIQIDHKDHDGLNNQRINLRICSNSENCRNKPPRNGLSSNKGVHYKKYYTGAIRWIAQIAVDGKKIHVGCFKTEKEAALAYNEAAKKYHGEFAYLNQL